jgi:hypothetical protein
LKFNSISNAQKERNVELFMLRIFGFEGLPTLYQITVYKPFWSEHNIVLQVRNDSSSNSTRLMSQCNVLIFLRGIEKETAFAIDGIRQVLFRPVGGERIRYSDRLRAGRSGDRIPIGSRFSATVQTGLGARPASCTMGTVSFPGKERPERDADPSLSSTF